MVRIKPKKEEKLSKKNLIEVIEETKKAKEEEKREVKEEEKTKEKIEEEIEKEVIEEETKITLKVEITTKPRELRDLKSQRENPSTFSTETLSLSKLSSQLSPRNLNNSRDHNTKISNKNSNPLNLKSRISRKIEINPSKISETKKNKSSKKLSREEKNSNHSRNRSSSSKTRLMNSKKSLMNSELTILRSTPNSTRSRMNTKPSNKK